jgi:hypothetical protein
MKQEVYQEGALDLVIDFSVERQGWVLHLISPRWWHFGPLVHTQIVLPLSAYEQGSVDEYLDALLALHFDQLGLLQTGW